MRQLLFIAFGMSLAGAAAAQSSGNAAGLLGGAAAGGGDQLRQANTSRARTSTLSTTLRQQDTHIGGVSLNPQVAWSNSSSGNGVNVGDAASGAGVNLQVGSRSSGATNSGSVSVPLTVEGSTLGGGETTISRTISSRQAQRSLTQRSSH